MKLKKQAQSLKVEKGTLSTKSSAQLNEYIDFSLNPAFNLIRPIKVMKYKRNKGLNYMNQFLKKLAATSLIIAPSAFADIYYGDFTNISPTLFSGGSISGVNMGNIGFVNAEFNFSINFYGLADAQVQEIKYHVSQTVLDQSAHDAMTSLVGEIDEVSLNINSYVIYSDDTTDPAGMLYNLGQSINQLLTHDAFVPIGSTEHRHLTGHYAVVAGYKVSEIEEAVKLGFTSYITAVADLTGLKNSLLARIAETDAYVESMVKLNSYRASNCMIRSFCWDYKVTNRLTDQTYWYRYSDHGNMGYQLANKKELQWEEEAKTLFKGPRLDEAMGYLTENIEYYSSHFYH